jgi:hypothetical protein
MVEKNDTVDFIEIPEGHCWLESGIVFKIWPFLFFNMIVLYQVFIGLGGVVNYEKTIPGQKYRMRFCLKQLF